MNKMCALALTGAGNNEFGQIAATGIPPDGTHHALLWQNGVWTDLQAYLPGMVSSDAVGISRYGQVLVISGSAHSLVCQKTLTVDLGLK